jgi:ABC-type transport system involved in multi-copper enzyme maturation permease subunit
MRSIFEIARLTFLEARMRKMLWAIVLLGIAFLALYAVGLHLIYADLRGHAVSGPARLLEPINFLALAGLYAINFLVVMLAVLTSVDTLAGEVASGAIQTIVVKPLRRWHIVIGKWLGLALMLAVFTIVMCAALMLVVRLETDYSVRHPLQAIGLIVLEGLIVLTLSILGGTRLSTLTNGVVVFMLYGLAFIAGWIEQFGSLMRSEAAVNVGIIISLLMPSEAMWKRAAYLMQPPFLRELGLDATPFGAATAPSEAMVVYAALYTLCALVLAVRCFDARDL